MGSLVRSSGNALAAFGGVNPFAEAGRGAETGDYLKFHGNHGTLTYGSDDEPLPEGSLLVMDLNTYHQGFICWKDSEVAEEVLVSILDGKPPREADLIDHGPYDDLDDGWREAGSISAILLEHGTDKDAANHPDVGKSLLFKTSTGGAVRSLKKLSLAYGRVFMTKPGELPIVEVTVDEYMPKNKKHGKKYAINFKIIGWITEDELAGIAQAPGESADDYEPEPEPVPEPAPRGRGRTAPAEEPAPRGRRAAAPVEPEEEVEEAPAPRTRRAAAPVEPEEEVEEAPAPRTRRAAAPVEAEDEPEDDGDVAPAPRGRSPGRGAPPANARVRRFQ